MRPRKLATILALLTGVRLARTAAFIAAIAFVARQRDHHPIDAIPADTSAMIVPAAIDPPALAPVPLVLDPKTIDGNLEHVTMFGDVGWAERTFDNHVGLVRTKDGGATWDPAGPLLAAGDICAFAARSTNEAWIVTCQTGDEGQATVSGTHDAGATWSYASLGTDIVDAASIALDPVATIVLWPRSYAEGSRDHRSIVFRSDDVKTWTEISRPGGDTLVFSDATHAFVLGDEDGNDATLRWSTDGGKSFEVHPAFRACAMDMAPVFSGKRGVVVAGCPSGWFAFRTSDAGATWTAGARILRGETVFPTFIDPDHGIISDDVETLITSDGGVTWTTGDVARGEPVMLMPGGHRAFSTERTDQVTNILAADEGKGWHAVASVPNAGPVELSLRGSDVLATVRSSDASLVVRSRDGGRTFGVMDRR